VGRCEWWCEWGVVSDVVCCEWGFVRGVASGGVSGVL
jgi:hypothetical protein